MARYVNINAEIMDRSQPLAGVWPLILHRSVLSKKKKKD